MTRALALIALLTLAGCAAPAINCPPLVQYGSLEQDGLHAEFPKDGPETQVQIEDYVKLRQACAATASK